MLYLIEACYANFSANQGNNAIFCPGLRPTLKASVIHSTQQAGHEPALRSWASQGTYLRVTSPRQTHCLRGTAFESSRWLWRHAQATAQSPCSLHPHYALSYHK